MICSSPFVKNGLALPCGQCQTCRINRRRQWTFRILLEACQYQDNAYVTLTYSDDCLPGMGSLEPLHLRHWLGRLRERIAPLRIRFYAVGEYGDESWRPHYHAILFGFPTCRRGNTYRKPGFSEPLWERCCDQCRLVGETWGKGNVDLGQLSESSAQYVAGYTIKKLTNAHDDMVRTVLKGRLPEFVRSSRNPYGIGAGMMDEVASELLRLDLEDSADVPSALRYGGRLMPLDQYMRRRLRRLIGRDENTPEEVKDELKAKMQAVRESRQGGSGSLRDAQIAETRGAVDSLIARSRIRKQRRSL